MGKKKYPHQEEADIAIGVGSHRTLLCSILEFTS